jgi:hypothetical protein
MACDLPTIVSSSAFDGLLGDQAEMMRIHSPDDVEGLYARLRTLLALTPDARRSMMLDIRQRVIAAHSLEKLMPRLVNVLKTGEL